MIFVLGVEYIAVFEIYSSPYFLEVRLVSGRMQEMYMLIFLTVTCDADLREGMCNLIVHFLFMQTRGLMVVMTLSTSFV